MPLSVTALADDVLRDALVSAAAHHNRSIFIPSGALVGTEGLVASRAMWKEVTITFRKHPKNIDFSDTTIDPVRIATETTVYDGPVRGIASLYPRNVNTMVTCALATLGLDRTRGRLIADPSLDHAVAEVEAHGTDGSYLATQEAPAAIGVSGTEMFRSTLRSVRVASGVRNPIDFGLRRECLRQSTTRRKHFVRILALAGIIAATSFASQAAEPKRVAIANFGPHGSLQQVIEGFKSALSDRGYGEGKVAYDYSDCNFDPSLVPQVLAKLEAAKPDLMLTVTTPMTQASTKIVRNQSLPIVFAPVTDPVQAGLVPDWDHGSARYVGASNQQSMDAVIGFANNCSVT